jgi:hypothetical protein
MHYQYALLSMNVVYWMHWFPRFFFYSSMPTTAISLYSRVDRFSTKIWFWMRVPLECSHFYVKVPKTANKCFCQVTFWGKVMLFRVKHYIKVQKFSFSHNMGLWVSKDAEVNVNFKNINLPWKAWPFLKRSLDQTTFFAISGTFK